MADDENGQEAAPPEEEAAPPEEEAPPPEEEAPPPEEAAPPPEEAAPPPEEAAPPPEEETPPPAQAPPPPEKKTAPAKENSDCEKGSPADRKSRGRKHDEDKECREKPRKKKEKDRAERNERLSTPKKRDLEAVLRDMWPVLDLNSVEMLKNMLMKEYNMTRREVDALTEVPQRPLGLERFAAEEREKLYSRRYLERITQNLAHRLYDYGQAKKKVKRTDDVVWLGDALAEHMWEDSRQTRCMVEAGCGPCKENQRQVKLLRRNFAERIASWILGVAAEADEFAEEDEKKRREAKERKQRKRRGGKKKGKHGKSKDGDGLEDGEALKDGEQEGAGEITEEFEMTTTTTQVFEDQFAAYGGIIPLDEVDCDTEECLMEIDYVDPEHTEMVILNPSPDETDTRRARLFEADGTEVFLDKGAKGVEILLPPRDDQHKMSSELSGFTELDFGSAKVDKERTYLVKDKGDMYYVEELAMPRKPGEVWTMPATVAKVLTSAFKAELVSKPGDEETNQEASGDKQIEANGDQKREGSEQMEEMVTESSGMQPVVQRIDVKKIVASKLTDAMLKAGKQVDDSTTAVIDTVSERIADIFEKILDEVTLKDRCEDRWQEAGQLAEEWVGWVLEAAEAARRRPGEADATWEQWRQRAALQYQQFQDRRRRLDATLEACDTPAGPPPDLA
ncbi:uncharacterized protein LOC134539094 [Bacillus rossius redtenbacheri]|uniref:uncharacterized protein LOC134539094 n=1 Tax=Bacillus rossius redtenbacheri TaxID=93214 RepID=UPI002FDCE55A